jgi:hypothetical protein
MPTLDISFDVPDAVVPRLKALMALMNEDRVTAGEAPWATFPEMAEGILKNRLKLLVEEAERHEVDQARLGMGTATPEQLEQIRAILAQEGP